jgi:hypothetical protein
VLTRKLVNFLDYLLEPESDGAPKQLHNKVVIDADARVIVHDLLDAIGGLPLDQGLREYFGRAVEFCDIGVAAGGFGVPGAINQKYDPLHCLLRASPPVKVRPKANYHRSTCPHEVRILYLSRFTATLHK